MANFFRQGVQSGGGLIKTIAYGGTALDAPSAVRLLNEHGLTSARTVPTPPGAPGITIGHRQPV